MGKLKLIRRYSKWSMANILKDGGARMEIRVQVHEFNQQAVCHEAIRHSNTVIKLLDALQGDIGDDLARSVAHNLI